MVNTTKPPLSIAMATYNGEKYLQQQLESLSKQTYLPTELVVSDDNSVDSTLEILERFKRTAPFPVHIYVNTERLGFVDNFFRAIKLCSGDWISLCDQDDVWFEKKLEKVVDEISQRPNVIYCAHRATITDENLKPVGLLNVPNVSRLREYPPLIHNTWLSPYGFTSTFRSFLIKDFTLLDRPLSNHDSWIFCISNIVGDTLLIPDTLAFYRRHGKNATDIVPSQNLNNLFNKDGGQRYMEYLIWINNLIVYLENQIKGSSEKSHYGRLVAAHNHYTQVSKMLSRRVAVWELNSPVVKRISAFLSLIYCGAYRNTEFGRAGLKAGAKDCFRLIGTLGRKVDS